MKGQLTLSDGLTLEGDLHGTENFSEGEVVFTTGMVGYEDSITDPSFKDQILVMTFPLIGNYGIPNDEADEFGLSKYFESDQVHIKGLVVNEYCEKPSHYKNHQTLSDYLKKFSVPILSGIDTRFLTEYLRDNGTQPGRIIPETHTTPLPTKFYNPNESNLVQKVSPTEIKFYNTNGKINLAILDCGIKNNTLRNFLSRDFNIARLPYNYNFFQNQLPIKIDALFISNGPGNPELLDETVEIIKQAIDQNLPIFGICLGNQLLARAFGTKTYKLPFGHRGQNHPCINTENQICHITSQNHGYAIDESTLPSELEILFRHANDQTIEGIQHKTKPFFAVQFHPEACPGPTDSNYLFNKFKQTIPN